MLFLNCIINLSLTQRRPLSQGLLYSTFQGLRQTEEYRVVPGYQLLAHDFALIAFDFYANLRPAWLHSHARALMSTLQTWFKF